MAGEESHALESLEGAPGGGFARLLSNNDILFALGLAGVLASLLLPLPTFVMDMLLSFSIAVALAIMVITLSARESIEFSTFPSLLLFLTLMRLSLNVASTRLILLEGDAGRVIEAFGNFVVGGQLVVGLVVFLILVIIQFVVITKGAERISEVAARFNLDAMPGKQMAIDADLNAGLIGEDDARRRREKIVRESEFYGSMDGASKFIRGDAVAGLIIVAVNLVGGFTMGVVMNGMTASAAIKKYAILAVGDGLVSQIPAIIVATSAGFLISKTSSKRNISHELLHQLLARSRPLWIASFLLAALVFVPGFPKTPFMVLAIAAALLARKLQGAAHAAKAAQPGKPAEAAEPAVEDLLDVDRIAILVGARLVKTVDPRRKDSLSSRIGPLRRKFAQELGIVLPLVRLRDSVTLDANTYEIRLNNHLVGRGQLEPERMLAMDGGAVTEPVAGQKTTEPVFNLPALWIGAEQKAEAELRGYTVVDPESVLVTHLSETLRRHSHEVLTRDDVQKLVERLKEKQPTLVGGVVGETVSLALLHRVLQGLLRDGIPVRDLGKIVEGLGEHALRTKDPAMLTELTRKSLVRTITERYSDFAGRVRAIVLDSGLEYELRSSISKESDGETLAMSPERAVELARRIADSWKQTMEAGMDGVVLLCDSLLRPHLSSMLMRQLPQLPVVAYDEIATGTKVDPVATVNLSTAPARAELIGAGVS